MAETRVGPYDRANGTHVIGHPTHYDPGRPKTWAVFYREKDVVAPGGSKHHQLREHHLWQHYGTYKDEDVAEGMRDDLMGKGYHAAVERLGGGRSGAHKFTISELLQMLNEADGSRD